MPKGTITAWSGAIVDIPSRWYLCDGTNGTPDLRDKFVVGAGNTYAKGATGGSVNHNHTAAGMYHAHTILTDTAIASGAGHSPGVDIGGTTFTSDNANGLSPYYALAFIMYKGA